MKFMKETFDILWGNRINRIFFYVYTIFLIIFFALIICRKHSIKKKISALADNTLEMSVSEFLNMRNQKIGKKLISKQYDFTGVYIIFNRSKNMHYVGQSVSVIKRVYDHFNAKGNGDIYADYKYGDDFVIKMIALENSGYDNLNVLEKDTISTYNAYSKGYNKTRGNRR